MKSGALYFLGPKAWVTFALAGLGLVCLQAQAQQVYRMVGPDGRVTFSDRPPPASANAATTSESGVTGSSPAAPPGLPFELRQIALKYPVVLYTGDNCTPCDAGRSLLAGRGVPFSEKTVKSAADTDALQRLGGDASLPFLTIGSQQLKGFSDAEWTQFLHAAGYPKSSALLPGYRAPKPAPLVAVAPLPESTTAGEGANPAPTTKSPAVRTVQPSPNIANPAGIKF